MDLINPLYLDACALGLAKLKLQQEKRSPVFYKFYNNSIVEIHHRVYNKIKPVYEHSEWPKFSLQKIKLFEGETLTDLLLANAIVLAKKYVSQISFHGVHLLDNKVIEYYEALATKKVSLASPFFNNLRKRGDINLSSCFIMQVGDSLKSIMKHVTYCANISKAGGGAGVNLGLIRSKGADIGDNKNAASSVMSWVRLFDQVCVSVNQLGQRPGAITVALPVWHADIEEFLDCQTENGDLRAKAYNIQPQVTLIDEYMELVQGGENLHLFCPKTLADNGINPQTQDGWYQKAVDLKLYKSTVNAREIWGTIQERQYTVGRPYLFFTDNAQINSPFKKHFGNIESANLCCFSGETLIHTDKGEVPIASLAGSLEEPNIVKIWNGYNYSEFVPVYKVADNQKLYRVHFSQGQSIDVTEDHNFWITSSGESPTIIPDMRKVQTKDLEKGMQLPLVYMPKLPGCAPYLQKAKNYVTRVVPLDGLHTVYCLTEPLRNMVIANGVPTSQCESYSFFKAEEYIHCCNLISVNLPAHDDLEEIAKSTALAVEMADLSLDITQLDIPETNMHIQDFRTIGIGMMGLADWLAKNQTFYSDTAFIEKTAKTMALSGYSKSVLLAEKLGACGKYDLLESEFWDTLDSELPEIKAIRAKTGIRNAMLFATAPNTSTSLTMGSTASFLPPYQLDFYDESEDHTLRVVTIYKPELYVANSQTPQEFITDATAAIQKWVDAGLSMEYLLPQGAAWSNNRRVSQN